MNFVTPTTPRDKWTSGEVALVDALPPLRKLVEDDCRRKESLGITALVIVQMKGESRNGNLIVRDNDKYEHLNNAEKGDLLFIRNVFKFLTGRSLNINVTHSNDMSFNDTLLQ